MYNMGSTSGVLENNIELQFYVGEAYHYFI
jgi:hypothetical protein